jgi:hypothetical protein
MAEKQKEINSYTLNNNESKELIQILNTKSHRNGMSHCTCFSGEENSLHVNNIT